MNNIVTMTLERLRAEMNAAGKKFGRSVREAQAKPQMPEPVREGNTFLDENEKASGLESYRVEVMRRLKLPKNMTWSAFLNRIQDQINPWVR